jgi:phage N-6-adenine-methyltransferase
VSELVIRDEHHYLATVADVKALCERIDDVGDARDLADRARAAQVWAQRARLGSEQVNLAAIAKLWAERRAGELLAMSRENGERARSGKESDKPTLSTLGISKDESSEWQKLASIPPETFSEAIDVAAEEGVVSAAKVQRLAVHFSSETDDWATPQELFDLLDGEFGFTLDVCASEGNAKAPTYYTAADDGLAQLWTGSCWMNPPYGREIGEWIAKARASAHSGTTVVCLVPARTDTAWWWDHARHGAIRFIRGRLKFGGGDMSAPFPSALVIFGRGQSVKWWESWPTV